MPGERSTLVCAAATRYGSGPGSRNEGTVGKRGLFHLTPVESRTKPKFGLNPRHKEGAAAFLSG